MTITEMHIAVNQGVDKVHSLQADVLLPEEIDLELNKNILRFVNQKFHPLGNKYGQGFEQSQKRIDDLRTLLKETMLDPVFKENILNGKLFVDTVELPGDYLYLVRQSSKVLINKCKPVPFYFSSGTSTYHVEVPVNTLDDGTQFFSAIEYLDNPSDNTALDVYPGLTLAYPTSGIEIVLTDPAITMLPGITAEYSSVTDSIIYAIDPTVLTGFVHGVSQIKVTIGGVSTFYDFEHTTTEGKRVPSVETTKQIHPNKFVQHDDIFKLLTDPFNTTKYTAPLSTVTGDKIEIYSTDEFLIDDVRILYIKKPAKVSKTATTQVSCDLPEHTHQEIVDMTVSTILGNISDPRYQIAAAEKMQSE